MSETVGTEEALWAGRVAIHAAPDGGYVLAYRRDGDDEPVNQHIPGWVVAMAERMDRGKGGLFGALRGLMPGG